MHYHRLKWITLPLLASSFLVLQGCGSSRQPPTEQIASAESYIRTVSDTEARDYPELRRAQDKLNDAKQAVAEEDYEEAAYLAEQALIDAKVAEAKAETAKARQATADLRKSIETLREEVARQ